MNNDPKASLVKILDIIDYKNDKEDFASQFLNLCQETGLSNLIALLPQEKQNLLRLQLSQIKENSPEQIKNILLQFFTSEQYLIYLKEATADTFKKYLQKIIPTLNDKQKAELESYLKSLSEKQSQPA